MRERQGRCRYCGRAMLFNDAERIVRHEAPMCPEFEGEMAKSVALGDATCEGTDVREFDDGSN